MFIQYPNYQINLNDDVIIYHNGDFYCIFPLDILKKYIVIHSSIKEKINKNIYYHDISIIYCPITSIILIHDDKYYLHNTVTDQCINLIKDGKVCSVIDLIKSDAHKYDIVLMKYNYILREYPDAMYPDLKKIDTSGHKKLNHYIDKYVGNIVYLIQYKSSKDNKYKYSVLISNNSNNIIEYAKTYDKKIKTKLGLITPIFFKAYANIFSEAKIIKL